MDTSECNFLVSCLGDLRAVIGVYPITCLLSFVASFVLMSEIFSSHSEVHQEPAGHDLHTKRVISFSKS